MWEAGLKYNQTITMEVVICYKCAVCFSIPSNMKDKLIETKDSFWCPNGHSQAYTGANSAQKLKEAQAKIERIEREKIYEESKRLEAERKLKLADGKLKRVHNGVCPCCNRSFENLRKHMETKHPDELKSFIELINNPRVEKTKLPPLKNQKGIIIINKLTQGEKRKLKKKT